MSAQLVTYGATNATYDGVQIYYTPTPTRNITVAFSGPAVNVKFVEPQTTGGLVTNLLYRELTLTGPHGD